MGVHDLDRDPTSAVSAVRSAGDGFAGVMLALKLEAGLKTASRMKLVSRG